MSLFYICLNKLSTVDIVFFCCIGGAIALAVGIYFLIPVLNHKQYAEQRENLRKREAAFRASFASKQEESEKEEQDS